MTPAPARHLRIDPPMANTPLVRLDRPMAELSFLERSLLLAELASVAYRSRTEAGSLSHRLGLPETRFYQRDGAQAYLFANETDAIICCRGTEPHEWNDIRADLDLATEMAETIGRVHRGFKREVDDLWPRLEQALSSNERSLWFTGHSLGGAMATICASRCTLSTIDSSPEEVISFGAPRVGNHRYVSHVPLRHFRWVNNNDAVPRVPPRWFGYRHSGQEVYLNRYGRISDATGWVRSMDRLRGLWHGLRRWRLDPLADHNMGEYITAIHRAVEQEWAGAQNVVIPMPHTPEESSESACNRLMTG